MQWLKVILAGLIEIIWVVGLSHSNSIIGYTITALFLILSFYLVISATKILPVGTVYAIFVGIGAAGAVLVDILLFGEPFSLIKIGLLLLLIIGIIGLKLSTTDDEGSSTS
ncbi:QacE family quaternary ammonium compound efflux SMR transporter [Staphylococcus simiae]|uniref:DMT family transporter n=1 Tax=Staphylococcus simiae TaxID=308354 RepID=UPI001A964978|nr:SMR family transporter [Staphylococcus simiae]MBO1199832.1 QacE family quaternary ammonium compound efflux SMR transporter [Staphylococcus simiae]MBO1201951.1 QacE family quaternary ammonium compound efflux SMR transporter [Staphylococcus simiae]MBO1204170.1 QacE family quaternary ammonium compound efflux SMR transporter [Staphylococcus simiae]MBO1211895.1 QacE family quaternary ammonium compound efflux SMR transporter [Staphylococcus simiae]MBO1230400.1 QacE family quaternary ammonium comp